MATGPLSGFRAVEITLAQFGPQTGMFLADWGADVIKIEPVVPGARPRTPIADPASAYFHAANRNKRSIGLDLRTPRGRDICLELLDRADIFVQNMRAGAMERLGLGYDEVAARNPRIVYASCSGFGPAGPYVHRRSLDGVGQAMGGLIASTGAPDAPSPAGATIVDISSSVYTASGILLALLARERDGKGQRVDGSLLNSAIALQAWESTIYLNLGIEAGAGGRGHYMTNNHFSAIYGVFETADGRLIIATVPDHCWPLICDHFGLDEARNDPRFATHAGRMAHHADVREHLVRALRDRSNADVLEFLHSLDIACGPVLRPSEVFQDPQVIQNEMVRQYTDPATGETLHYIAPPFTLSRTPFALQRRAPDHGEHSREVLSELGYSTTDIEALVAEQIVS